METSENEPRKEQSVDQALAAPQPSGEGNESAAPKADPLLNKAWAPLLIPSYRSFWVAGLISNLGTWVHETGAVWLVT